MSNIIHRMFIIVVLLMVGCSKSSMDPEIAGLSREEQNRIQQIQRAADANALRETALFTFAVWSDTHGNAVEDSTIASAVSQMADLGVRFVVGVGDNLEDPTNTNKTSDTFLAWVKDQPFWMANFWPTVADGENEYYGTGSGDWGAGRGFLDFFGVPDRPGVIMAEDEHPTKPPVSYYVPLTYEGVTVHLIQLPFSDTPKNDPIVPFREETRAFMEKMLQTIEKDGNDIVVIGAHSEKGRWIYLLNDARKSLVYQKCDLAMAGTTHDYKRTDHGSTGPLALTNGFCYDKIHDPEQSDFGWIAVYVFDDPLCIMTMYVRPNAAEMTLPQEDGWWQTGKGNHLTYVKFIESGSVVHIRFANAP